MGKRPGKRVAGGHCSIVKIGQWGRGLVNEWVSKLAATAVCSLQFALCSLKSATAGCNLPFDFPVGKCCKVLIIRFRAMDGLQVLMESRERLDSSNTARRQHLICGISQSMRRMR